MDQTHETDTCMACSCPCEMHKEHNHPVADEHTEAKVCAMCGHENKGDENDCGCGK